MVTYGTTAIPSDQITVIAGGTVSVSAAFENTIGLVGGMNVSKGSATPGEVVQVRSGADAATKFGDGTELHEQVKLAFLNGAGTVWALPVKETSVTESFTSTSSGTLGNVPIMDPNVQPEHSITATDVSASASMSVTIVYKSPPSAPTAADTLYINPITGEWAADESADYDISYVHGDYSVTAVSPLLDKSPRRVVMLSENENVVTNIVGEVNNRANDFDFMLVAASAAAKITDPLTYTDNYDERRASVVYPGRGYTDEAKTTEVRTVGAVAAHQASLTLGLSSTNNSVGGILALREPLTGPTDAGDLIDVQVTPLLDYPPLTIVKDMTTSTEPKFERAFAVEIVDEATELSHLISREYVGDQNTAANRASLRRSHENVYGELKTGTPRLLNDHTVSVEKDPSNPKKANVNIGLDVVDVMDTIDVTITVGDIIRQE